jgi:hypothetical protein
MKLVKKQFSVTEETIKWDNVGDFFVVLVGWTRLYSSGSHIEVYNSIDIFRVFYVKPSSQLKDSSLW